MNSKSRSGHGALLVLVMALLMLLAVMGVAHGFFSASVVKYNQYATKGDVAIDLAENALAEAHRVIATKLNDKSCKLFQMFREKLGSFTFSLTSSDLPYLAAELKKQNCFSLVKDEVTITVLGGVSTSKAMPTDWDRAGRLRICASIVHQESKIVRRLAQIYDFRISLPAVPRPLDRHTLVIGDGIPLISTYANANETINGTQKRLDELKTVLRQRKEDFEKTKEELAGNSEAQAALPLLDLAAKECQQLLSQWPKIEGLSLFPEGAFTITTDSAQLDLSTFNLPAKVRKRASSIDVMEKQQAKSYQSLCTTLEKCANGKAEHNRVLETLMKWCQDLEGLVVEYEGLLVEDYLAFQQNCKFHEDDDMALFEAILASLVPADLIYKSTAVIYDFDVHQNGDLRNINLKFKQLINRGPAFSGVLYVMNKDEELVINNTFKGQLLIVVEGDCVIERAIVDDKSRDTITIIGLGRMAIDGKVEGSIISKERLLIDSGASIDGNLIVGKTDFKNVSPDQVLAGRITRDERLITGPKEADGTLSTIYTHRLYGTLGPMPVGVEAERK